MTQSLFDPESQQQSQTFVLDFKRVLARAIRFWYVVVISLVAALFIAFYKNRYTERVYPITASIIIREMQEIGGAELLYKNVLVDQYRNYLNEPYIIKSLPLIERVIRNLNFHIAFYREGRILTTEAYEYIPVKAQWCDPSTGKNEQYVFTLLDSVTYSLSLYREKETDPVKEKFRLGDSIRFEGVSLCLERIYDRPWKNHVGIPYIMVVQDPASVAASYASRLNVKWAEAGAGVINLSLTGTLRMKEQDFLSELIRTYQEKDLEKKNEAATRTINFIRNQLVDIRDSLKIVEFQLERFGGSGRIKDMSVEAQKIMNRVESVETQRAELLIRQNYLTYLENYLNQESARLDQIILPSSMGINDVILNSLIQQMVTLQTEVRLFASPEKGNNPLVESKALRIRELRREIENGIRSLRATDKIKMNFLNSQLKALQDQLNVLPSSERQLISVQRNYSLLENLYVFLMQKLSEAAITRAANTSDIILVNPPVAGAPIHPKPSQNYIIALMLGLLIPFGIFVLFELVNNKVQSKEDIEKMTTIPFIGGVGHNTSGNNLTVKERPKSGVAESFRALRTNLNYFTGNKTKQVFMITSSISGEGKTFTTINLATVFALSGKKTLIVGADMRRPKIFEDFRCSNDMGLSTYLSGLHLLEQIIQKTEIENLYLISGGPVPPNPSELLLTDKFQEFIKSVVDLFDFVIIDTPPLALVTDAFVISKFADHTVFVLRQNFSPKQFIRSIDEYYRSGKIKSISILLNDIYKSGLGYGYGQGYAYNYGYSYGYGYGKRKNGDSYYSD